MSNEIQALNQDNEVTQKLLLDYLKQTNSNLMPNEQAQFVAIASAFGLNPWKREIYAVAYGNGEKRKLSIIVGYETYLRRAESFPQYDGYKTSFGMDNNVITCTCEVYRKDRKMPTVSTVYLNEYHQGNTMWNTKPRVMLEKVAICTAFRRAFPSEMGGFPYAEDEMPTAEDRLKQQGYTEVSTDHVDDETEKRNAFISRMERMKHDAPEVYANVLKEHNVERLDDVKEEDRKTLYVAVYNAIVESKKTETENNNESNSEVIDV